MNTEPAVTDSSYAEKIEAAVSAGDRAEVLSLFARYREDLDKICRDRDERHALEHRRQEREFLNLAENSADGVIRLDRELRIVYVNPAAAEMMHSSREELLGKTPVEFSMPTHLASLWQGGVERVLSSGRGKAFEYEFDDLRTVHYLRISMIPEFGPDDIVESVLVITRDISEQKKAVIELRNTGERFKLALGTTPLTVYSQNGELRYTWVYSSNPKLPAELFLEHTDHEIYPEAEAERMTILKQRVLQTGQPDRDEFEATVAGGKQWLYLTVAPLRNNEGQVVGIIGAALDITERKRFEEELRQSRDILRTVFAFAPAGVVVADAAGKVLLASDETRRIYGGPVGDDANGPADGYTVSGLDGIPIPYGELPLSLALGGRVVNDVELLITRHDRSRVIILAGARPLLTDDTIWGAVTVFQDITGRKRAEEKLKKSEERQAFLLRLSDAIRPVYDSIEIQRTACALLGEYLGADRVHYGEHHEDEGYVLILPDFFRPGLGSLAGRHRLTGFGETLSELRTGRTLVVADTESSPMLTEPARSTYRALEVRAFIVAPLVRESKLVWTLSVISNMPREWTPDEVALVQAVGDRTWAAVERARAEAALRESEERLRIFIEHVPVAIAMFDRKLRYLAVSRRWLADYRLGDRNIIGLSHYEVFPELPERWKETNARVLAGAVEHCDEEPFLRADGTLEWVRWENHPWRKANGEIGGIILFTEVITQRKQIEEQIARLRREQEAFMRHEVKNLFAPIQLFAELMLGSENLTDEQSQYLNNIIEITRRAVGFIDSLKRLQEIETGKYTLQRVRQPLNAVILQAIHSLEPLAEKSGVIIHLQAPQPEAVLPFDPNLMPGVFINLIQNAIEHVAKLKDPEQKTVMIEIGEDKGKYIVRINNKGEPIPPERLATFFDKFNVGPEKKGGTGLGTTYAWLVTRAHGGNITVSSDAENGTTVTVELPKK